MKSLLSSFLVLASLSAFSSTNMMLPILDCQSTGEENLSITVFGDFENLMLGTEGKGFAVSSEDGVRVGSMGTFYPAPIMMEESGVVYKSDLIVYNDANQYTKTLSIEPTAEEGEFVGTIEEAAHIKYKCSFLTDLPL